MVRKLFIYVHKILGIPLSIVFVLWFLSGFAMIWTSFPHARQPNSRPPLTGAILPVDSLLAQYPDTLRPTALTLSQKYGRNCYRVSFRDSSVEVYADSFRPVPAFNDSIRNIVIAQWCDAPVARIDTLTDIDQWIPFERWADRLPIYKYHFNDPEAHQLYMTPEGEVIQFTSAKERHAAWIGAIPHWIYYTPIRRHQTLWTDFVIWAALLGCIMCLAGIIAAVAAWWKQRRSHGFWHCPYKKKWWKWHFILGLLFGWCAITFAFSGYMSMADTPSFLKKEQPDTKGQKKDENNKGLRPRNRGRFGRAEIAPVGDYMLRVADIVADGDSATSISWQAWDGKPYYRVTYPSSTRNIDASCAGVIRDFILTEDIVRAAAAKELPDSVRRTVALIDRYDNDYYGRKAERVPLPVYKVTADDYLNTVIYYNPKTLSAMRVDDNSRMHRFLYSGLHALNIKILTDHPWLWYSVMFILLTGGLLLSLTGLILAWQWLVRKIKSGFRIYKS